MFFFPPSLDTFTAPRGQNWTFKNPLRGEKLGVLYNDVMLRPKAWISSSSHAMSTDLGMTNKNAFVISYFSRLWINSANLDFVSIIIMRIISYYYK